MMAKHLPGGIYESINLIVRNKSSWEYNSLQVNRTLGLILFKSFVVGIVVWCFDTMGMGEEICVNYKRLVFLGLFPILAERPKLSHLIFINSGGPFPAGSSNNHLQITINPPCLFEDKHKLRRQTVGPPLFEQCCHLGNALDTGTMISRPFVLLLYTKLRSFHWKLHLEHPVSKSLGSWE